MTPVIKKCFSAKASSARSRITIYALQAKVFFCKLCYYMFQETYNGYSEHNKEEF